MKISAIPLPIPLIILDDPKHSFSEKRWAAFGKTEANRLLSVIFTKRDKLIRIISARDMNRGKEKGHILNIKYSENILRHVKPENDPSSPKLRRTGTSWPLEVRLRSSEIRLGKQFMAENDKS
ncbi:MAG: BrnT family toxin [Deltaproteobacteria bacterium]